MPEEIFLSKDTHIKTKKIEREVDTPADFTSPEELYDDLVNEIKKYHPSTDLSDIEKAYRIAKKAHEGQLRKSGEPYIIHPLCVAIILAELELDKETIIAGLLHDVVEDTVMIYYRLYTLLYPNDTISILHGQSLSTVPYLLFHL